MINQQKEMESDQQSELDRSAGIQPDNRPKHVQNQQKLDQVWSYVVIYGC